MRRYILKCKKCGCEYMLKTTKTINTRRCDKIKVGNRNLAITNNTITDTNHINLTLNARKGECDEGIYSKMQEMRL